MDDLTNDIGTAIMRLRNAFAKHNIPAPDILEWSDGKKGFDAAVALRRVLEANHYTLSASGDTKANALVAGMTLRWEPREMSYPSEDYRLHDGTDLRAYKDTL